MSNATLLKSSFLILPTYYLAHIFITWARFDPFRITAEAERI
jgi:hypothetical protein